MQHSFPKLIIGAASQAAPLVSSAASAAGEEALSPGADLEGDAALPWGAGAEPAPLAPAGRVQPMADAFQEHCHDN